MYVQKQLYTKEILSILKDAIYTKNINDSSDLDHASKALLTAHAIRAFEHDIDLCFSSKALENLSDYVITRDHDFFIDFHHQVQEDNFNHFSKYFDTMINEIIDEDTQEKIWRKSA